MPGIDPRVGCYKLDINPKFKPICQIPRRMVVSRRKNVTEEVSRLLYVGFIKPMEYPKWISNIMAVPKKNGKIRVCIDFTDLNKACPTYPYMLPRISDLVDDTTCFERLSFMDAFYETIDTNV